MTLKYYLIFVCLFIAACNATGNYRSDGPCKGFKVNPEACERAAANSIAIANVSLGHTLEDVRRIMGKGPERRELTERVERWAYITDYDSGRYTTISFEQGRVAAIK